MHVSRALGLVAGLLVSGLAATQSFAGTWNFESTALGTYTTISDGPLTITYLGGDGAFDVDSASPGAPISGHALISFFQNPGSSPFLGTFSSPVTSFTIGVGDFNADVDNTFLEAYDASMVLIDSDTYVNPASKSGGDYLTVAGAAIKYVKFWDAEPFAGAVYWDDISYSGAAVPLPPSALMGLGLLGGLGVAARLRKRNATTIA